jgi:hypothetical protein
LVADVLIRGGWTIMTQALASVGIDPLDRHQRRRDQSIPTISVLSGPVGLGVRRWRAWAARHGLAVVFLTETSPRAAVIAWVRSLAATHHLIADAAAWLVPFTMDGSAEVQRRTAAMSGHDFEWFWGNLSVPAGQSGAAVCRLLLADSRQSITPERLAGRLLDAMAAGRLPDGARALASLADVVMGRFLPTLLFAPSDGGDASRLASAGRLLEEIVTAVPTLPAAVAADAADVAAMLRAGPPSHTLDVLREGLVPVNSLGEVEVADCLRAAGATTMPASAVRRLAEDGASEELASAFADAARRIGPKDAPEEEDAARSAAERFLFELLESHAATTGLFVLNQTLDFRHGPAAAEVDLLAASLRLVIELDGSYFHLRDAAAYRRDRRKDWELQRRGYLVLRFLSDDVVERLEEILNTILEAVELRRASEPK